MTITKPKVVKEKFSITPSLAVKLAEHLYKENPGLILDGIKQVEKPIPYFDYIFLFPRIMTKFCSLKGYSEDYIQGVHIGGQRKWEQTIFIAIILKLYSEAVFKEIYDIENGVRHNLAGMLECNQFGISNTIPQIIQYMQIYDEFSSQVINYVDIMKKEFRVKKVDDEEKQPELYQ